MKQKRLLFYLAIALPLPMFIALTIKVTFAQGNPRFRLPFDGSRRLTANVDHNAPFAYDNRILVYNGEEYDDCSSGGNFTGPYCYDGHEGTDYSLYLEPVLAAASGRVTFRGTGPGTSGRVVYIDHGNGYESRYLHLNNWLVNVGDEVVAGQQIAVSGDSGLPGVYHLHFEVRHNGNIVDPFGWRGTGSDPLPSGGVCLWGDGQCFDVTIEDGSYRFFENGSNWNWSTGGNSWTQHYISNTVSTASSYARYRPYIPHTGPYAVYVWIPSTLATTRNARYEIADGGDSYYVDVDQQVHSDEWVYLGSFQFWKGTPGYVRLNSNTGEADGSTQVGFDSVRFRQYRVYVPMIVK